jgi:hypothetical protein
MSEDFKFYFTEIDQHDWPELPPWFYRSDEEQVHENMFGDEAIDEIFLHLIPAEVETIPGAESGGDAVRIGADVDLRIRFESGFVWVATTPQDFYFRLVDGTRGGRDRETQWEMFAWYDREDWDSAGRIEDAGWGGIKAMFLESLTHPSRRTTPTEVIEQLRTAYNEMEADDYIDCLSTDFVFFAADEDVNNPSNPIDPQWYLADEIQIHNHMFASDSGVESISLTLTTSDTEFDEGLPEDPTDDTWTYVEDVDLWLYQVGGLALLATTPSEFHLRVDPDEEGPYGETMWEVYEWYDLGSPGPGRVEDATWGGIKALYR